MTQRQLAKKIGVSMQVLSNIECGNNWPSMPVYIALFRALNKEMTVAKIELPII